MPIGAPDAAVRRLKGADADVLASMVAQEGDLISGSYSSIDLEQSQVFGAFENDRLVALGRASVELPDIWILSGIFHDPVGPREGVRPGRDRRARPGRPRGLGARRALCASEQPAGDPGLCQAGVRETRRADLGRCGDPVRALTPRRKENRRLPGPGPMSEKTDVVRVLNDIADLLDLSGERFKPEAYRRAARSIEALPDDLRRVLGRGELEEIPGVGEAISEKIKEFLSTGKLHYLDELRKRFPPASSN